jgi:hypothetical protein
LFLGVVFFVLLGNMELSSSSSSYYYYYYYYSPPPPLGVTTSHIGSSTLFNDISPFTTVLDADCPILNLHFTDVLFNIIIPSALRSSL